MMIQEPIIIHECVDSFPRDAVAEMLPAYDFTRAIMSPHQHGWPIRRIRQWAVQLASTLIESVFIKPNQCLV